LKLFFFAFTLHADQRGVVLRFGRINREVGPGFHWKFPFDIDEVYCREITPTVMVVGPQSLTTKDDVSVVISMIVTFRIEDVKVEIFEVQGSRAVIEDAMLGAVSSFVTKHTWGELRNADQDLDSESPADIDKKAAGIARVARRRAKKYGVNIIDVQFVDVSKSRSLRLIGHEASGLRGYSGDL